MIRHRQAGLYVDDGIVFFFFVLNNDGLDATAWIHDYYGIELFFFKNFFVVSKPQFVAVRILDSSAPKRIDNYDYEWFFFSLICNAKIICIRELDPDHGLGNVIIKRDLEVQNRTSKLVCLFCYENLGSLVIL